MHPRRPDRGRPTLDTPGPTCFDGWSPGGKITRVTAHPGDLPPALPDRWLQRSPEGAKPGGGIEDKAATIRKFLELCDRKDWVGIGEFIGVGYSWLDHTVGTVGRTPTELAIATAEDEAWEDPHFQIDHLTEGTDGRVFVQMTRTGTLPQGSVWRGVQGTGQMVTRKQIDIITFDDEGKIVGEEGYEDALSIMRQLGKIEPRGGSPDRRVGERIRADHGRSRLGPTRAHHRQSR